MTLLSLTFVPLQTNAANLAVPEKKEATRAPTPAEAAEAKALKSRLDEINALDKTELKAADKKNLHKEVRSIEKKLRELNGGVYLSVGALIVIILLLIILL